MKLEKLKMPMPKGKKPVPAARKPAQAPAMESEDEDLGLDLEGDLEETGLPDREAISLGKDMGPADEEGMELEASAVSPEVMEQLSDEDLMAELKKRGLMGALDEDGSEEAAPGPVEYA